LISTGRLMRLGCWTIKSMASFFERGRLRPLNTGLRVLT
jgi:hypothetical protein